MFGNFLYRCTKPKINQINNINQINHKNDLYETYDMDLAAAAYLWRVSRNPGFLALTIRSVISAAATSAGDGAVRATEGAAGARFVGFGRENRQAMSLPKS
jgi:hypothetical protein